MPRLATSRRRCLAGTGAGGEGHVEFRGSMFEPNAVFQDLTCDFEKYIDESQTT